MRESPLGLLLLIYKICGGSFSHHHEDYVSMDDLPLQDARLVRADVGDKVLGITSENPFAPGKDVDWVEDALKDIAFYLRSHKFNEYDRRYEKNPTTAPRQYHTFFPKPALRSLHWEVHKYCETSFLFCIDYLRKRIKLAGFKRADDTAVAIQEQRWTAANHKSQIDSVEQECVRLRQRDDKLADPFQGPLERFQWRTTASYYMCWFAMNEVATLRHLSEQCDNFAYCLDQSTGSKNSDFRAKDDDPFACATYSFCPDPCCGIRLAFTEDMCADSEENPCYATNQPGFRKCKLPRRQNISFKGIILNRWNVSCNCPKGWEYDSSYGICVDIDECTSGGHTCKPADGAACLNTAGSYKCVCKWGFTWDKSEGKCVQNEAIALIKMNRKERKNDTSIIEKSLLRHYVKKLFRKMFKSSAISARLNSFTFFYFYVKASLIVFYFLYG